MAGLIQQGMQGGAPAPAPEEDPMLAQGQPMVDPNAEEDMGPEVDESDPTFQAAMELAMRALYENNGAAGIAEALRGIQDPVESLGDTTYNIIALVEERMGQAVPDELLVLFTTNILNEVVEIGQAAGIEYENAHIGKAVEYMILRFLGENGYDTTELEAAMDQVDPQAFNQINDEGVQNGAGGQVPGTSNQ